MYQGIHKTARKRSGRFMALHPMPLTEEVPGWRKCTTIKPLPLDPA